MAHFGVAHLAFGQSDIDPARAQLAAGIIVVEPIVKWRLRQQGGVAILIALRATIRIDAPAVADNEDDGLEHSSAFSRRSRARTSAFPGCGIDKADPALVDRLVKWRNQLLALFCLVLFAAFGVFYFQHWVVQKPFGIVLFIGEGLTPGRLAPTRVYAGGVDVPLALDLMPHMAMVENFSNDFAAPDRAAAATALATG